MFLMTLQIGIFGPLRTQKLSKVERLHNLMAVDSRAHQAHNPLCPPPRVHAPLTPALEASDMKTVYFSTVWQLLTWLTWVHGALEVGGQSDLFHPRHLGWLHRREDFLAGF